MKQPTMDPGYSREQYDAFGRYAEARYKLEHQAHMNSIEVCDAALAFADAYRACQALGMCEPGVSEKTIASLQPERPVIVGELFYALDKQLIQVRVGRSAIDPCYRAAFCASVMLPNMQGKTVGCDASIRENEFGQPAERVLRKMVGAFEVLLRGCIQTVGGKPL